MKRQNEDGGWGVGLGADLDGCRVDRTGLTALALLCALGCGHSYPCKETYDGVCFGFRVGKGLQWLMSYQRADGSFITNGDYILNHALATLALSEACGVTGSSLFKDQAQKGVEALERMQLGDGSWGDDQSLWASQAIKSAESSGLSLNAEGVKRAREYFRTRLERAPSLPALVGHLSLNKDRAHPSVAPTVALVAEIPSAGNRQDFTHRYWGSVALFLYDGPLGDRWKKWSDSLRQHALFPAIPGEGHWSGGTHDQTLLHRSLGTLSLGIWYRCPNVFSIR